MGEEAILPPVDCRYRTTTVARYGRIRGAGLWRECQGDYNNRRQSGCSRRGEEIVRSSRGGRGGDSAVGGGRTAADFPGMDEYGGGGPCGRGVTEAGIDRGPAGGKSGACGSCDMPSGGTTTGKSLAARDYPGVGENGHWGSGPRARGVTETGVSRDRPAGARLSAAVAMGTTAVWRGEKKTISARMGTGTPAPGLYSSSTRRSTLAGGGTAVCDYRKAPSGGIVASSTRGGRLSRYG